MVDHSPPQRDDPASAKTSPSASGGIPAPSSRSSSLNPDVQSGSKANSVRDTSEESRRQRLLVARALLLPTEFVIIPLLGLYAGRFLDHRWGTGPWLMISGGIVGLAAALRSFFEAFKS